MFQNPFSFPLLLKFALWQESNPLPFASHNPTALMGLVGLANHSLQRVDAVSGRVIPLPVFPSCQCFLLSDGSRTRYGKYLQACCSINFPLTVQPGLSPGATISQLLSPVNLATIRLRELTLFGSCHTFAPLRIQTP